MKYKKNTKKILAFTLAELLLAMSIVGIVAAIILPAIRNLAPNREMIMFKKAYGVFTRVVNEMINDEELYPEAIGISSGTGFANLSAVTDYKDITITENDNSKFCKAFALYANIVTKPSTCNYITTDGVEWTLPSTNFSDPNKGYEVAIDVNGNKSHRGQGPDLDGIDVFYIYVKSDGTVYVENDSIEEKYLNEVDLSKANSEI